MADHGHGHTLPTMLTPHDVADALRLTVHTVKYMLRKGTLPGVKIGKHWRVHPDAIRALTAPNDTARSA